MSIIIVEPQVENRSLFTQMVEARGHAVVAEATVTAALEHMRRESFDGVVVGSVQADLPADMLLRLCAADGRAACVAKGADDEQLARFLDTLEARNA